MAAASSGRVYVALLRGINVSGKNKLPMEALRDLFEEAGYRDVETYIQSGNVVFASSETRANDAPVVIQKAILDEFGYRVPLVLRSAAELRKAFRGNPFLKEEADIKTLHLAFLADTPKAATVKALDPERSPPDRFAIRGRELYLSLPNGVARSKLTNAYFDSKLQTTSTLRNWKTVTRLVEMVDR